MTERQKVFQEVKRVGEKIGVTDKEIEDLISAVSLRMEDSQPVSAEQAGKSLSNVLKTLEIGEGKKQ